MSKLVSYRYDLAVNGGAARNTFTAPTTGAPGVASGQTDISKWRAPEDFGYGPDECMVVLTADKACDADNPLAVYGCVKSGLGVGGGGNGFAFLLASLNNAAAIPIVGADSGFAWPIDNLGGFDFLAVGGLKANPLVTFSGGALVTVQFVPIVSRIRSF